MYEEFGILKQYIENESITDILINGPNNVYVDDNFGLRKIAVSFS